MAISDPAFEDNSRFAFIVCGDIHASELNPHEFNGEVYFYSHGYRENILGRSVLPGRESEVAARIGEDDEFFPAPSREELAFIIKEENKFPLVGAAEILEACASLQHFAGPLSFVNRTSLNRGRGTPTRRDSFNTKLPGMAVLVSQTFGFNEALLFWNCRANDVITSWLSLSQLKEAAESIRTWLDSDLGASLYTFGEDLAFASSESDQEELSAIFKNLASRREREFPKWRTCDYAELLEYDLERPYLQRKHLLITRQDDTYSFLPESVVQTDGALALTLEWPTLMLPRRRSLADLVSDDRLLKLLGPEWRKTPSEQLDTPRCRIIDTRHVRFQLEDSTPVRFTVPQIGQILQQLFEDVGFRQFRDSSQAQYQNAFIKNCGSLLKACLILRKSSTRNLLTLLADNQNRSLPGWILKEPPRRALNQVEISKILRRDPIAEHSTDAQALPDAASQLLSISVLERGFQLSCQFCSALLWYRAEEVGQNFTCHRCYQNQVVRTNPLWLYKLPEVIFQLFNNNGDVALLALFHMLLRFPTENLQYALDSEVVNSDSEVCNNLDFACLSNGKIYVGEAKSNADISKQQFSLYEGLALTSIVDGVVFATTEANWNRSLITRAERLRAKFAGEVILLTRSELLRETNKN